MHATGLEAVFLENRAALIRFLRARGAGDDAEDLVQELWAKLGGSSGPVAEPLAYLYRMADNLMIDRMRSDRNRRRREAEWFDATDDRNGGIPDRPNAERALLGRERLRALEGHVGELGARSVAIFRRYRLDGIGQQQIADEQGISLSAIEKHLQKVYRALIAFRRAEDAEPDEPQRHGAKGATDGTQ